MVTSQTNKSSKANEEYQKKLQKLECMQKDVDLAKANAVRSAKAAAVLKQRSCTCCIDRKWTTGL
eukprot:5634693-Amphidinium_carterae.1